MILWTISLETAFGKKIQFTHCKIRFNKYVIISQLPFKYAVSVFDFQSFRFLFVFPAIRLTARSACCCFVLFCFFFEFVRFPSVSAPRNPLLFIQRRRIWLMCSVEQQCVTPNIALERPILTQYGLLHADMFQGISTESIRHFIFITVTYYAKCQSNHTHIHTIERVFPATLIIISVINFCCERSNININKRRTQVRVRLYLSHRVISDFMRRTTSDRIHSSRANLHIGLSILKTCVCEKFFFGRMWRDKWD